MPFAPAAAAQVYLTEPPRIGCREANAQNRLSTSDRRATRLTLLQLHIGGFGRGTELLEKMCSLQKDTHSRVPHGKVQIGSAFCLGTSYKVNASCIGATVQVVNMHPLAIPIGSFGWVRGSSIGQGAHACATWTSSRSPLASQCVIDMSTL